MEKSTIVRKEKETSHGRVKCISRRFSCLQLPNVFQFCMNGQSGNLLAEFRQNEIHVDYREPSTGRCCLHFAAAYDKLECVKVLLRELSANPNIRTMLGEDTALHIAVQEGHRDVAYYLMSQGADPNLENKNGKKPINLTTDEFMIKTIHRNT